MSIRPFHAALTALCLLSACGGGEDCTPDDDGLQCTVDLCDGGDPTHVPAGLGVACDQGGVLCDGHGACIAASCGEGVVNGTERCDDGNAVNGDGCDANCTPTACGNGVKTAGEACDDGNRDGLDGCDAGCGLEPTQIAIVYAPASLVRGQSATLLLEGTYPDGVRQITQGAAWSSGEPAIVTVNAGRVRALAAGDAVVTATVAGRTASASVHVHRERIAFVTSEVGPASFSMWAAGSGKQGLAGADAICASSAAAEGLLGTYRAWVSDDTHDAYCRAHGRFGKREANCGATSLPATAGPWIRTDGRPFSSGIGDLVGGHVLYPVRYDEKARQLEDTLYYTATDTLGALLVSFGSGTCGNWQAPSHETVYAGDGGSGPEGWTQLQFLFCDDVARLLCLEIGEGAGPALEPFAVAGKLVFATSIRGKGDLSTWPGAQGKEGLEAADEVCASRAAAAALPGTFRAFLGTQGHPPGERVVGEGPWVRPDGVLVAASRAELLGGTLRAPVAADEYGAGVGQPAWTGGITEQGLDGSCAGWTSSAGAAAGVYGWTYATLPYWSGIFEASCSTPLPIVCLQE